MCKDHAGGAREAEGLRRAEEEGFGARIDYSQDETVRRGKKGLGSFIEIK